MVSLSLGVSAYGLGGMFEPEVACLSLLGGALTVRRRDVVLPLAGRAATDAEDEELIIRALVRVYGWAECVAAAAGLETVRLERRSAGMLGRNRELCDDGWQVPAVVVVGSMGGVWAVSTWR